MTDDGAAGAHDRMGDETNVGAGTRNEAGDRAGGRAEEGAEPGRQSPQSRVETGAHAAAETAAAADAAAGTEGGPLLSVLMPIYNEERTLAAVVAAVEAVPLDMELLLVDDGSRDGSGALIDQLADGARIRAYHHARNQGKGAAVRTAIRHARGQFVLIQDADLEYDPHDYPALLAPLLAGKAQVVFGSRAFSSHTAYSFWFVLGNKLVTLATNILYNCYISDMETCYKVMTRDIAQRLDLRSRGFEIEPEITAKLVKAGYRIYEVPISYAARSRAEGKKLTWQDGLKALRTLLRYRFAD